MKLDAMHETEEATMLLAYAIGGATDVALNTKAYTWEGFCDRLMTPRVGKKDGSYYIRGGKLRAPKRSDENLIEAELLILDVDSRFDPATGEVTSGGPAIRYVADKLTEMGLTFVAHTSHSARPQDDFWKYRVVLPAKTKSVEELNDCLDFLIAQLHGAGVYISDVIEARKWSQPWFLPRVRSEEDKEYFVSIRNDGLPFDVVAALEWAQGRRKAEEAIHAAKTAQRQPADVPAHQGGEGIRGFNDAASLDWVRDTLEGAGYRFGYFDRRQQSYRYMRPGSETKTYGLVVFKGSQGHWCTYSHHGNADPLSHKVCDPFELATIIRFGGDRKAAAKALLPRPAQEPSIVEQIAARQVEGDARPVTGADYTHSEGERITISDAFVASREQSKPQEKKLKRIDLIPWGELKDVPVKWLVKDILPAASFAAIYGKPGSGKSFAALYIAAGIASGRETFGKPVTQGSVIYVAAEGGAGMKRRTDALKQRLGLDDSLEVHFVKAQLNLSTSLEDMEALFVAIREKSLKPVAIFLDTFARIFIGDENSAKDVGACIAILGAIQAEFDCTVVIIHHSAKNSQNPTMRGSSALLGAVDTELHCERVSAETSADRVGSLTVTKQKDGEDGLRFGFRLHLIQVNAMEPDATSLALEPIDTSALSKAVAKNKIDKAPDGYQGQAFRALENAIKDAGEVPNTAGEHIPAGMKCVKESLWRQYWKSETTAEAGKDERGAWYDAKMALKDKKLMGNWNDWCWIVSK